MVTTVREPIVIEDWQVKPVDPIKELALKVAEALDDPGRWTAFRLHDGDRRCAMGHAVCISADLERAIELSIAFVGFNGHSMQHVNDYDGRLAVQAALRDFGNS